MGHTNYIRNKRAFTDVEWKSFTSDVKKLLRNSDVPLADSTGMVGSKPEFERSCISFNGVGSDAHETACVTKDAMPFDFCKTAHKPYDKVVVEFYKLVRKYIPDVQLSSDGGDEVFNGVKIKVDGKWTYYAGDHNVKVGDTVILPPTPYSDGNWEGVVTEIGSSYYGACKTILGVKVDKKPDLPNLEQRIAAYLATDFHLNEKAAAKGARGVMNYVKEHLEA